MEPFAEIRGITVASRSVDCHEMTIYYTRHCADISGTDVVSGDVSNPSYALYTVRTLKSLWLFVVDKCQ